MANIEDIKKVIIYCRVSSKKQVTDGNGLDSQEQTCRAWAKQRGYTVERVFQEKGISGSKEDRPAFKEMLDFLFSTDEKYVVLALDINRFARDTVVYGALRDKIRKLGHIMQTVNMTLEETEESELLENVSASLGQYERKKNAKRTKMNMVEHVKQGYWVLNLTPGYKRQRINNRVHWIKNEPTATYLHDALEGFANNRFLTQKDVYDFLQDKIIIDCNGKQIKITLGFVKNLLTNEKYTGCFAYPRWNIPYQKWHIEPIITTDCFKAIQDKLNGKKSHTKTRKYNKEDEDFPLRRWVKCAVCGHLMTADKPRSKSGKHHLYYHCYNKDCPMGNKNIPQATMHAEFEDVLRNIAPRSGLVNLVKEMIVRAYNEQNRDFQQAQNITRAQIQAKEQEKQQTFNLLLRGDNPESVVNMCQNKITQLDAEIAILQSALVAPEQETKSLDDAIDLVSAFIKRPLQIWVTGNYQQRQSVLNLCFANKMLYDKDKKFRTPELSPVFGLFNKNAGILEEWRAQKDSNPQPSDP